MDTQHNHNLFNRHPVTMSPLDAQKMKAVLQAIENLGGQEYCTLDELFEFNERKFSSDAFDSGWTWWEKDETRNDEDLFCDLVKFADDMLKTSPQDYRKRLSEFNIKLNPLLYFEDFKTCFYNYVLPPYRYDDDDHDDDADHDDDDADHADVADAFLFDLADLDNDYVLNLSLDTTACPTDESDNED